jgi:hypothetical protein
LELTDGGIEIDILGMPAVPAHRSAKIRNGLLVVAQCLGQDAVCFGEVSNLSRIHDGDEVEAAVDAARRAGLVESAPEVGHAVGDGDHGADR